MTERKPNIDRRRAIKYGVTAVVAAGVAGGAGYLLGGAAAPGGPKGLATTETVTITKSGAEAFPKGVLKIGVTGPMTGTSASEGEEFVKGATLALDEINARGGVLGHKLELVIGDVGSEFESGTITSVWEKLVTMDKVDAVVCGYTGQTQFEIDIAKKYNMIYLFAAESQSTEAIIGKAPEQYPTVYNIQNSYIVYQTEAPKLIEKWASEGLIELPNRKVAIVTSDNAYSRYISEGLRDNFKARGWTNPVYEMVAFGTVTEWRPILAKIRADPPAVIINTDWVFANEATFMEQFLENPTKSHMFIQYGPSTPEFVKLLGPKATGVIYNLSNLCGYIPKFLQGTWYRENFKARWGFEPGMYGPSVYVMPYIYKDAVERVGDAKDGLAVGKAIFEWTAKWGPGGLIVFDPKTHLARSDYMKPAFFQIWDEQRLCVDPEEFADGKVRPPPWWSA